MGVVGIILSVIVVFFVLVLHSRKEMEHFKRFNEQFPPISDAEFVALCKPGVNPEIALKVRRIVADNLGISYMQVYPTATFAEDLGVD